MGSTTEGSANVASQIENDAKGQVINFDGDVTDVTRGLTLTSTDGTTMKLSLTNAGAITATALS
jgi:hypothetical protein